VGGFDSSTRRAFTLPLSAASSLQKLATVRLEDAGTVLPDGGVRAFVEWLPVTGSVPTGNLTATAFDETSNILTGLYLSKNPLRYEVVTLQVSNTEARFATLTQSDTPDANGPLISRMEGTSSALGVQVGQGLRTLSISGTQATWAPPVPGQVFTEMSAYDRARDRVISIGSTTFTPPMTVTWTSTVQERQATSPTWMPLAFSGMGLTPFIPSMAPLGFIAYDAVDERLVIAGTRPVMIGGMTMQAPQAIEASLRTRAWRDLGQISSVIARAPFFYDRAYRQVFAPDLSAYSLAPGRELQRSLTALDGRLPPQNVSSAASAIRLPDGSILVTHNGLMTYTPSTGAWNAVPARVPANQVAGASLAYDPVGNRALLLFGSSSLSGGSASAAVLALSADGQTLTPVATTGVAPSARFTASAVVVGTELVVVGGFTGTAELGDVFSLDLTTLVWRRVGQVAPRRLAGLLVGPGSVVVVGGRATTQPFVTSVERVELASGTSQPINVTGPAPIISISLAAFAGGLAGFDIGDSFDLRPNAFLEFRVSGNQGTWTSTDPNVMDQAISPAFAVSGASCNEGLFLGPSSFRVTR
jgi:hypothetical protein